MLRLLIRLALYLNFRATLCFVVRLQYGAGMFYIKISERARRNGHINLAKNLEFNFAVEDNHAQMLGGLVFHDRQAQYIDNWEMKYYAAKLFFWFKDPSLMEWHDILAFLLIFERQLIKFYEVLCEQSVFPVDAIALKILEDKYAEAEFLENCLRSFHSYPEGLITIWRDKLVFACLGVIIDLIIMALS